jgi:CRP-like cAMP-binding protein
MEKLKKHFESIGFTGESLEKILESFILTEFKKNDFVVEEGKVARYIGFVESGMFQYYVMLDGEEKTTYINVENTFLASVLSFVRQQPAQENIRALSDGKLSLISRSNLNKLVAEVPGFKDFYIALLEHTVCGIDASRHDLIVLSAEQRYAKMLRDEPQLLQQIPLQYLASMLGVTPRHLSRIRAQVR